MLPRKKKKKKEIVIYNVSMKGIIRKQRGSKT